MIRWFCKVDCVFFVFERTGFTSTQFVLRTIA
jgi:hypothetical protein